MKFVDKLFSLIASGVNFLGDMLAQLFRLLVKPLSYLWYFLDGVFYFIMQLALIVWKVISLFVALIQFFGALVAGFFRSIVGLLSIDFSQTPTHYPSTTQQGMAVIMDIVRPMGLLDVVPLIMIALTWFYFVKKMIGLLGGELRSNA